jgi:glycosyltransferase involved in cell wall biosynthesis
MKKRKPQITAVILTHNEEENLPRCFKSLNFVDEIIVVDDNSNDRTVEIAQNFRAHVFTKKLTDFATQRNFALSKVETPWVLLVDADEVVTPELEKEIQEAVQKKEYNGFSFPRKNIIFGKWIRHSGWYPDYQLHLFRTKKGGYHKPVHEQVNVEGKVGKLKNPLLHHNYESVSQYLRKIDRYTDIEALSLFEGGYRFSLSGLFTKPLDEFLRRFFAEEGYKDGVHGLVLALLQAFSTVVTLVKVWGKENFKEIKTEDFLAQIEKEIKNQEKKLDYWLLTARMKQSPSFITKFILRLRRKFS